MKAFFQGLFIHPFSLFLLSVFAFFCIVWLVLPFAIYGVRRRLDEVIGGLRSIEESLSRLTVNTAASTEPADAKSDDDHTSAAADMLFVNVRKEMLQFAPLLSERELDSSNIVFLHRKKSGADIPCIYLSHHNTHVRITFPLDSLTEAYSGFDSDQLEGYIDAFLSEKYGFFSVTSPDGRELHVNIEPLDENPLDIFSGIVREQLVEIIRGSSG